MGRYTNKDVFDFIMVPLITFSVGLISAWGLVRCELGVVVAFIVELALVTIYLVGDRMYDAGRNDSKEN